MPVTYFENRDTLNGNKQAIWLARFSWLNGCWTHSAKSKDVEVRVFG